MDRSATTNLTSTKVLEDTGINQTFENVLATNGNRLINFVVDIFVCYLLLFLVGAIEYFIIRIEIREFVENMVSLSGVLLWMES